MLKWLGRCGTKQEDTGQTLGNISLRGEAGVSHSSVLGVMNRNLRTSRLCHRRSSL